MEALLFNVIVKTFPCIAGRTIYDPGSLTLVLLLVLYIGITKAEVQKTMRVTTKGQVTIPRNVREALGIAPESEIEFIEENGRYYLAKSNQPKARKRFARFRGIATAQMSTDEIMRLTRDAQ